MKKPYLFFIAVAVLVLQLTGCEKIKEQVNTELRFCNIKKMQIKFSHLPRIRTYDLNYDSHGNLVSMLVDTQSLVIRNHYFLYDSKGRLTDVIQPYTTLDLNNLPNQFDFEQWTRYTYNNNNKTLQPVADTFYSFGRYNNGKLERCATCPFIVTSNYEYDNQERVSKITKNNNSVTQYKYDSRGNLIFGNRVYDDSVNIYRTNAIWMLITKDYSRNNPFNAESYNSHKLPEQITNTYMVLFNLSPITDATISYICDSK